MSYTSILKNIPEILSQPTGIAAIASVGIHGAIAFILPLMPVDTSKAKQAEATKPIGLTELTQAEQKRLPQTIPPQVGLQPQTPLQLQQLQPQATLPSSTLQQTPLLPPLPPASSTALVLPPIPKSPSNYSIASVPRQQSLRVLPRNNFQIDNSGFNVKTTPQTPSRFVSRYDNSNVTMGESKPLVTPGNLPDLQANNTIPTELPNTAPLPIDTLPPSVTGEANSPVAGVQPGDDASKVAQNQQLVASIGQTPQAGDTLSLAGQGLPTWQLGGAKTPNVPELPSTATQGNIAKTTTIAEQFIKVKQQYPNLETRQPISETIARGGVEGRVEGGLVVDGEGKIESLDFLDGSVSSEQKTAVREHLRQYFLANPPDANGKPKYYPFSLSFRGNSGNASEVTPKVTPSPTENQPQASSNLQNKIPQAVVSPQTDVKPLPGLRLRTNQPLPTLQTIPKPSDLPQVRNNQPVVIPQVNQQRNQQPLSTRLNSNNQPTLTNTAEETVKPLSTRLNRNNQPTVTATPEATAKPLLTRLNRSNQPTVTPPETVKPASQPQVSNNESTPVTQGSEKLLQQLRDAREKRQTSNKE